MDETANLKLPYILAAQSQKHVTHNEALRALDAIVQLSVADKDLGTPPGSPADGDRYIVGAGPTGSWSGHATHVAAWQDGAWAFYVPVAGWLAWVDDESRSYLFAGGGWVPAPGGGGASLVPKGAWSAAVTYATGDLVEHGGHAFLSNIDGNRANEPDAATPGSTDQWTYFSVITGGGGGGGEGDGVASVNPVSLVGVNATADTTNRLSVASPASLFSHEGAGHQLKIVKDGAGDTASVLFQTDFSGRAEFGLVGDDNFHVKVSADGSVWREAIIIDRSTGAVRVSGMRETLAANRSYYVRTDGSDSNDGLSNTSGGAFRTIQKAVDTVAAVDLSIFDVTINVAAGTYTGAVVINSPWIGAGDVKIVGDATTPANVIISTTSAHCISAKNFGRIKVSGVKFQTTTFGIALVAILGGTIEVIGPVNFGACATYHMNATQNGMISCSGVNYAISGATNNHAVADARGYIYVTTNTITITGTPALGTFAQANRMGLIEFLSNTFSGSATGVRYSAANAGGIFVAGGGANYFPGSSAGAATSPGWYV